MRNNSPLFLMVPEFSVNIEDIVKVLPYHDGFTMVVLCDKSGYESREFTKLPYNVVVNLLAAIIKDGEANPHLVFEADLEAPVEIPEEE